MELRQSDLNFVCSRIPQDMRRLRKNHPRVPSAVCRDRGCHVNCLIYHRHTVRLLKDMAAWCRYFTALTMEDSRGALGPGEEMRCH